MNQGGEFEVVDVQDGRGEKAVEMKMVTTVIATIMAMMLYAAMTASKPVRMKMVVTMLPLLLLLLLRLLLLLLLLMMMMMTMVMKTTGLKET